MKSERGSRAAVATILIAYTVCYFGFVFCRAAKRPLWLDEVTTLWTCRLPSLPAIWAFLSKGSPESAPAGLFVAMRPLLALTGNPRTGVRLLAILGFYLAQVSVFLFTRARLGTVYAMLAALVMVATAGFNYATDGTSYGALLGLLAFAAWSWQRLYSKPASWSALIGMWLGLTLSISFHYYAVLFLIPISLAEAARSVENRRIAWRCWIALAASCAPLLIYRPLMAGLWAFNRQNNHAPAYFAQARFSSLLSVYQDLWNVQAVGLLICTGAVLLFATAFLTPQTALTRTTFRPGEAVLAASLVLFPVFMFVFARLFTNTFMLRYALAAVPGYCIFAALLASSLPQGRVLAIALSGLLVLFVANLWFQETRNTYASQDVATLEKAPSDLPVVVGDGLKFIELMESAPPRIRARLVYLTPPVGVMIPDPTNENIVKGWLRARPLPVYSSAEFLPGHRSFLVYYTDESSRTFTDWLTQSAQQKLVEAQDDNRWVYLVSMQ